MQFEPIESDCRLESCDSVSSVRRLNEETPKEREIRLGRLEQAKRVV